MGLVKYNLVQVRRISQSLIKKFSEKKLNTLKGTQIRLVLDVVFVSRLPNCMLCQRRVLANNLEMYKLNCRVKLVLV